MTMFRRVTRSQRGFTSGIVETSCLPSSTHLWFFCYHAFLFRMKWKRLHGLTSVHWCHHSFLWDVHCLPWDGLSLHTFWSGLLLFLIILEMKWASSFSCTNVLLKISLQWLLSGTSHSLVWATAYGVIDNKRAEWISVLVLGRWECLLIGAA